MATVSKVTAFAEQPLDRMAYTHVKSIRKRFDFSNGTWTTGDTWQLIDLPAECVVTNCRLIVTTVFGAATNGTLQFSLSGVAIGGALLIDALAKGKVYSANGFDTDTTAGKTLYVTAADTLDIVNGTAAPTTGKFDLIVDYIDILSNT